MVRSPAAIRKRFNPTEKIETFRIPSNLTSVRRLKMASDFLEDLILLFSDLISLFLISLLFRAPESNREFRKLSVQGKTV